MSTQPVHIHILQGRTLRYQFQWADSRRQYREITAAAQTAPARLTVPGHGLPDGWAVNIVGAEGMTQLNRPNADSPWIVSVVDADTLELDLNAAGLRPYTGGGWLEYLQPVDLAGYSARMQVRQAVTSADVLLDLNSDPGGGIVIDNAAKTITFSASAAATAALDFDTGVWDLEMIAASGDVELLAAGTCTLVREVTRA